MSEAATKALWNSLSLELQHEVDTLVSQHRTASAVKAIRKAALPAKPGIAEARDICEFRESILKPPPRF